MTKQNHLCVHSVIHAMNVHSVIQAYIFRMHMIPQLWNRLRSFLTNDISFPILTPQTAIFGFSNGIENNVYKITNHILLIFKLHVYKSRERSTLEASRLIKEIKKVKPLEKNSAQSHVRKLERYNIKWQKTHRTIKI